MKPGPKPRSAAAKRLRGFPGKRRVVREPARAPLPPPAAFDDVPSELADQPVAVGEWRRLVSVLRQAGQLAAVDRGALIAAALEWSTYVAARAQMQAHGLTVRTPNGYEVSNAYVPIANRALRNCVRLWGELGLNAPASDPGRRMDSPAVDDFAEFDDPPPKVQ